MNNTQNGTLSSDNFSYLKLIGGGIVLSFSFYSVIQNSFVIYILKRTQGLNSYTGDLLVSQTVCDILAGVLIVVLGVPDLMEKPELYPYHMYTALLCLTRGLHGININTSAAISLNLFMAVCHSTVYRRTISRRKGRVFNVACWVVNLLIIVLQIGSKEAHVRNPTGSSLLPNYTPSTLWFWISYDCIVYIFPAIVTIFCFIKIVRHARKIQICSLDNQNVKAKIQLSKLMTGLSLLVIVNSAVIHILRAQRASFGDSSLQLPKVLDIVSGTFITLIIVHHCMKFPLFLFYYKPFRDTTVGLCRCQS